MERKIGEIFELNGKWYQCLKPSKREGKCYECIGAMKSFDFCKSFDGCNGRIFKELEKVGEPFTCNIDGNGRKVTMQEYNLYDTNFINTSQFLMHVSDYNHKRIAIEVKQNKEQMEEKKLNLKPFDIEAAKEGKPVCTRDGYKARIICFDAKAMQPIIALVTMDNGKEFIETYYLNGRFNDEGTKSDGDLMMLPEKKEGWVNVYNGCTHATKEQAEEIGKTNPYFIKSIKVEWEE